MVIQSLRDEDARVRLAAAQIVLDRGWGRPVPQVEVEPSWSDDDMTATELAREVAFALTLVMRRQEQEVGVKE